MLFFKRILKFDQEAVAKREQRHALRHKVEPTTPLRAALQRHSLDKPVTLLNLSSGGAGVQIDRPIDLNPGDRFNLRIELGGRVLRLDGTVAHREKMHSRTKLGLKFEFANFQEQRAYLQMLEPVAIGASLKALESPNAHVKEGELIRIKYEGPNDTRLTVWRKFAGQSMQSFELRMSDYFVRGARTSKGLDIYTCESQSHELKQGYDAPVLKRVTDQKAAEISQLFRWVIPHLSSSVPDDIREFLTEFRD